MMFVRNQIDLRAVQGIEKSRYLKEGNWNGALGRLNPLPRILNGVSVAVRNLESQPLRSGIFFTQSRSKTGNTVERTEVP